MRLQRRALLALAGAAVIAPARAAQPQPSPLVRTIQAIRTSIVALSRIEVDSRKLPLISGTGFAVGDGRFIITNAHVIAGEANGPKVAMAALVRTGATLDRRGTSLVGVLPQADLALLRLEGPPLPPLALRADAALVPEGTEIAMTGFPIAGALGPVPATHRGIVSAHAPNTSPLPDSRGLDPAFVRMSRFLVYQLDIVAYPGNSGSPVFLPDSGEVIGILNSTFIKETKERVLSDPSGISFAIPSSFAAMLLAKKP